MEVREEKEFEAHWLMGISQDMEEMSDLFLRYRQGRLPAYFGSKEMEERCASLSNRLHAVAFHFNNKYK